MKQRFDAILQPAQAVYLDRLLPASQSVLAEMESFAEANRVPIADREVAWFLEITARAIDARRALEIGMAIGYGAAHLARGMKDGKVVTIEPSDDAIPLAESYLTRLGLRERVEIIKGFALNVLPDLDEKFDLIYLDAVKEEYSDYLDLSLPKLRLGGVVIVDNLLWGGRVADETSSGTAPEASTLALREFNKKFVSHPQLKAEILSFGDGVGYAVKIA